MVILNKRSQFFLMSLVLVYLAIIVIFTYIRSADYASVSLFEKDSDLELRNFIEGAIAQTSWLPDTGPGGGANYWMVDRSWLNRKLININWIGPNTASYALDINPELTYGEVENCTKEVYLYSNATRSDVNIGFTTGLPPCRITWTINNTVTGQTYYYYVYYNKQGYAAPTGRPTGTSGNTNGNFIATLGTQEESPPLAFCTHLKPLYPYSGITLNCTINATAAPGAGTAYIPRNFTLNFIATDLKFNGSVYNT